MKPIYKKLIFYGVTLFVGLVMTFCWMLLFNIFNQASKHVVQRILCDSFFITGVILGGFGGIIWIATTGVFDMLAYGFKNFGIFLLLPIIKARNKEKYYEYALRKKQERKAHMETYNSIRGICIVGLIFIGIAALFLIGY